MTTHRGGPLRVIVVGGGVGGLTAAIACGRRGFDVTVLERAEALSEVGAGLQLSPNAIAVLIRLGLGPAVAAAASAPTAAEFRDGPTGRTVFAFPLGAAAEARWGAPYLHLHRADLITILTEAVEASDSVCVRLGAPAAGYTRDGEGAQVRLDTGETVDGDVVIGADGLNSVIRTQMIGLDAPRFTGQLAWRGLAPVEALGADAPPARAIVWAGPGRHAVTYRVRGGAMVNIVGVVDRADWRAETWDAPWDRADALADFAGWPAPVVRSLEACEGLFRWGLFDRAPLPRWVDGPVALLGDAAHPMLPFLAQGAAMAIEDAEDLAVRLAHAAAAHGDAGAALKSYADVRGPRTARVQAASRANARLFHTRDPLIRAARHTPMRLAGRLSPGFIASRLDWLYGYTNEPAPHSSA